MNFACRPFGGSIDRDSLPGERYNPKRFRRTQILFEPGGFAVCSQFGSAVVKSIESADRYGVTVIPAVVLAPS
jgi:hypothetical protein